MCGIAGIINSKIGYCEIVNRMNSVQYHRGPDYSSVDVIDEANFGHTRLSIVDIKNGNQPMRSFDNQKMITFNGEIYGYKDLIKKLTYPFKSKSDTEVLLALYENCQYKMLEKITGMFSFGIWDNISKSLFLARDRFGEKPLFYAIGRNGEFIFSSEIKAILATNLIKPIVSKKAIKNYLRNLHVEPYETIYENIFTLEPACYLVYKNGKIFKKRYFKFPKSININEHEAIDLFKEKLESSIEKQLVADVDVGAFLSGGLDSSTIVSIATKFNKNLKTFSFDFPGEKSERKYAEQISQKYKTDHYVLRPEIKISDLIIKTVDIFDDPFADSSSIPSYLISKMASKYTKVILSGDGADELLGGYTWWYSKLIDFGSRNDYASEFFYRFLAKLKYKNASDKANAIRLSRKYSSKLEAHYYERGYFSDYDINRLISSDTINELKFHFDIEDNLNDVFKFDAESYLAGDILVKVDRTSMANSLELRSPFLDHEFASFCMSLPENLKINSESSKIILRKSFQDNWTSDIRKRPKQGFGGPVKQWLMSPDMEYLKNESFSRDRSIFRYINFDYAKKFFNLNNQQTWSLLILSIWFERNNHI